MWRAGTTKQQSNRATICFLNDGTSLKKHDRAQDSLVQDSFRLFSFFFFLVSLLNFQWTKAIYVHKQHKRHKARQKRVPRVGGFERDTTTTNNDNEDKDGVCDPRTDTDWLFSSELFAEITCLLI